VLGSDWYKRRLETKQQRELALWQRHRESLERCRTLALPFDLAERRRQVREQLARVRADSYLEELAGTIGADPFHHQLRAR
jgi:hypothetical protein